MPRRPNDPLGGFNFLLETGGLLRAGFSEVTGLNSETDVVDYREGTDAPHVRKLSGLTKYGNVTLKRGVTVGGNALELFKWHSDVSAGLVNDQRKKVVIVVQNEAGDDNVRFVFTDAWPVKYDPSDLNAKGNKTFIESVEFTHEGMERKT